MARATTVALTLCLALLAMMPPAPSAQMSSARSLRVDWSVGQKRGRPVIEGYVYNDYQVWASNVRLLVQALDASGQVIDSTLAYVYGDVPPWDRSYFEARAPAGAAGYRVTVSSFDWRGYGGGGGM